jgi:glucuronosyltransferase
MKINCFQRRFRIRAKELSTIFRDQPQTPVERAVFWVEYVMRHNGAPHLRSPARDLNIIQYHSLDVIAFIGTILVFTAWIFKRLLVLLINKCWRKQSNFVSKHKKD